MTPQAPTPETDAARVTFAEAQVWPDPDGDYADADVCARLERERDAARAAVKLMRDTFAKCGSPAQGGPDPFTWVYRDVFAAADKVLASFPNPESSFQNPQP